MSTIPERIKEFNSTRLPAYTAMKYQLMAEDPFRFFRGTCHLFYEDLCQAPAFPDSPLAWICGDLHLENFGTYKGNNRLIYFDLNDFDEALLAPAAWEVVRMVASIYVGCESLGISKKETEQAAGLFLGVYTKHLGIGKALYVEPETAHGIVRTFMDTICERKQKELIRQRSEEGKNGKLRIRIDRVRLFPIDKTLRKELSVHVNQWLQNSTVLKDRYTVLDACFRVAGTGSLGCRRYLFLVQNTNDPKKHLLIDMKEALPSSVQPWLSIPQPTWTSEAERVVAIQHRMQNINPALLSTTIFQGSPYVLKEMQPTADKIDFLQVRDRYKDIACVVEDMAFLTASAQLRSAGRQGAAIPDLLIEFGHNRHWQEPVLQYARTYAGVVKKDYQDYFTAYKAGFFS
ncbi:DUF2252 domain-containing protein [Puia dinghuensis]|uniref:DUF2252 domain-containing protein n=1 Tax=Puia dinghuensis TaxID=1792502 RepID=A0A8J2U8D3_9BACT|nr:DUF2252 family protein [Puia dinghuensis]GGA86397.1 hypothetical protein GCM10011511_06810 [Puia dinghuensis]